MAADVAVRKLRNSRGFMTMSNLQRFKDEFSDRVGIQFSCAGLSPISRSAAMEISRITTVLQTTSGLADAELVPLIKQTRDALSLLIDAPADQIAFAPNCATALSQIAFGFPLTSSDTVVTIDQEYASNFYPWKVACDRTGAKLVTVQSRGHRVTADDVIAAVKPGTKLVGVSWVQFQTGTMLDLKRLGDHCRSVGAFLAVDGIQGVGQLPISFRNLPIDFLVAASHKWVCGPLGQAFFAIRPELMEKVAPQAVGSITFNRAGTFADPSAAMESTARRFEAGGYNFLALAGLRVAVQLLTDTGIDHIAAEIASLTQLLRRGLQERGIELATPSDQPGGITSFELPMQWEANLLVRCRDEQIAIARRGPFIRTAIHAFSGEDEVLRFLAVLEGAKP